ncbi:MAG TPA: hypothetical protein VI320_07280 [Terracidiphilus sp.]
MIALGLPPSAMATTSRQFDIVSTSSERNSSRMTILSRVLQLCLFLSQTMALFDQTQQEKAS